ncbi:MAG: endonuclease MutS2, partial [Prevotellaceae bacterium]|nr:endonuclease MutS2 [Prevotellaceae bacterium]
MPVSSMERTPIYPSTFEAKIGFDHIRSAIGSRCVTRLAAEMLAQMSFCSSYDALCEQLEQTAEMQAICTYDDSFPQSGYVDVLHFVGKISIAGAYLDEQELMLMLQLANTVSGIVRFFKKSCSGAARSHDRQALGEANQESGESSIYPRLHALVQPVQTLEQLSAGIDKIIDKLGRVKDSASPELQQLRRQQLDTQQLVSRRMMAILRQAQANGYVDEGVEPSLRDGRAVIPVSASCKRKVAGIVLDESATGKTSFIEPAEVVELNNRLRELGFAEKREVIKILTAFTASLAPHLPQIAQAAELLGCIDFIRAKALYANSIHAVKPTLFDEQIVDWHSARHPLLEAALRKEGKPIVPLTLRLTTAQRILLISGPNAGGKSVCIKTVGLLQYMLQCGLPIPVAENSEAGIFEAIFIDIGDEQSLENDLSTYSSHLKNMKHFLRYASSKTLILIDEFGTGTEPQLGGAIAEGVLASLVASGTFGIITTHYANLKHFASKTAGLFNGAMLFDLQKIEPLFKLECGTPGSSFAFEIAHKIGLPEETLSYARSLLGEHQAGFDKSLRSIARDRRYWEEKREQVRRQNKKVEELAAQYEAELERLQGERQRHFQEAKEAAKKLLAEANRQIENTIRGIKEAQAEKQRTTELRSDLTTFAQQLEGENVSELKPRIAKTHSPAHPAQGEAQQGVAKKIELGDCVRIASQNVVGEVVQLNSNGMAVLAMGSVYTTVAVDKLEPTNRRRAPKSTVNMGSSLSVKRLNFKPSVDVRGMRADEALNEVEELVDQACMFGVSELRILHG